MSEDKSKSFQSYALLNMKMKEVEKKKMPGQSTKSSSANKPKEKKPEPPKAEAAKSKKEEDVFLDPDAPDRSYGDYFCKICDSHMNSDAMWEAHITGKRHMKNVKKGDTDSKYEDLDVESAIKYELRNVKDPIIGLNYIHEIRRREPGVPAMYNCFLCCASLATVPLVIEHAIGVKHRLNFMRENNPKEYQLIEAADLKKGLLEPLVNEKAALLEAEYGRGVVKVKKEKPKPGGSTYKRSNDDDDDDDEWPVSKKPNRPSMSDNTKDSSVWKSIDISNDHFRDTASRGRDKSPYYQHDERSRDDDYRRGYSHRDSMMSDKDDYHKPHSKLSDRDDYSRHSLTDDYPRRSALDDYPRRSALVDYPRRSALVDYPRRSAVDDYSRPVFDDYARHSYVDDYDKRSEEFLRSVNSSRRYKHDQTPERQSSVRPDDFEDSQYSSHSYHSQDKMHSSTKAPESANNSSSADAKNVLKDFVVQLTSLSKEYFFKIVLMKLQDMEFEDLTKNELDVLMKIYSTSQQIICKNLPPQVQQLLKGKFTQNPQNARIRNPAPSGQNLPPTQASTEISSDSMLSQKFSLSDINELLMKARQTTDIPSNNQQPANNMVGNLPPPSSTFPLQPSMPPPPSNFPQPSRDFSDAPRNVPPGNNFTSSSSNFPSPSNNASNYSAYKAYTSPAPGFTNPSVPRYTSPSASSYTSPSASSYTSPSAPSYTSPSASSIPGLTLAGENPPKPPFSDFSTQQSWQRPNQDKIEFPSYRRY